MAPFKYENDLKNKLEQRTLPPSKEAWKKLSGRLDNEQKSNNNKRYWWLGAAASTIGAVFVASQLFGTDNTIEKEQKIVTTPKIEKHRNINNNHVKKLKITETPKAKSKPVTIKEAQKSVTEESVPNSINTQNTVIAQPKMQHTEGLKQSSITPLTFEEQKIQDVVAQVHELHKTREVTDADIDALLKKAERDIRLNRVMEKNTSVVDASALLEEVETELDQSFRTKVFEAIKASYNTVKTAVAQRND